MKERLKNIEDNFTERKLEGAGGEEFKKTIVAFANSNLGNRTAILFIGVSDKGEVKGIGNADKLQKTIRKICEQECYPPINHKCEAFKEREKDILAIEISESKNKPHFSGPAYIRKGSESIVSSQQIFEELILSRTSKLKKILEWKNEGKWIIVVTKGKKLGDCTPFHQTHTDQHRCKIIECDSHTIKLHDVTNGKDICEPINETYIDISYDIENQPMLIITGY